MQIHLLAIGQKMPAWVQTACAEYEKRLPRHLSLQLRELPLARRSGQYNAAQLRQQESELLLKALPERAHLVLLDTQGKPWSTEELARQLQQWQSLGQPIAITIGGPDGYDEHIRQKARQRWSLGPLTLPHPLVRVILYEQLYRAHTILSGHPYHRS